MWSNYLKMINEYMNHYNLLNNILLKSQITIQFTLVQCKSNKIHLYNQVIYSEGLVLTISSNELTVIVFSTVNINIRKTNRY